MVVRKFNYYRFFVFIVILVSIIVFSIKMISDYNYKKTDEYKLLNVGYNEEEIKVIKDKLSDDKIESLLKVKYNKNIDNKRRLFIMDRYWQSNVFYQTSRYLLMKYNKNIVLFIKEKYFIYKNLSKYLDYKSKNKDDTFTHIVAIVNTEADVEWLDNEKETDTSKNELMLVNRLYGLSKDYEPDDIIDVPVSISYSGVKISKSILSNIEELISAAKDEGYIFVLSDGYRSYADQEKMFNNYKNSYGYEEADKNVARPGHSEYQTGISFQIVPYNKVFDKPRESEEYKWLKDNAYKYGFIFRYPEDKKDITLFDSYTWRLRFVGTTAASIIESEKISFEEYYAYFVDKE